LGKLLIVNTGPIGRRRDVLTLLRASASAMTIVEIAGRLDMHPNTIRFHLDALTASGQVSGTAVAASGPGRPPLVFQARRSMDPGGPRNYRLLAEILVDALAGTPDPVAAAIDAGRVFGSRLADPAPPTARLSDDEAVARLVGLLDDLGFAAESRSVDDERQVGLRHCPFLDLVQAGAALVCPLHLGLMRGAMGALDTAVTVERLDPFAEPDLCLAHLGAAGASR
jgi:predicted ArsR family transcriptional regulator